MKLRAKTINNLQRNLFKISVLASLFTLTLLLCSNLITPQIEASFKGKPDVDNKVSEQAFDAANKYRNSQGLEAYLWSDAAYQEARDHNEYQISMGRIVADDFSVRCNSLKSWGCAGNVAQVGHNSEKPGTKVVKIWMASPGDRRNLESNFKYMGVAGTKSGKYWWFTMIVY